MSKEIELECPSGLRVRLRGIKGKDLDGLRDKRRVQTGEAFSRLLDECTLEVIDHGPYSKEGGWRWANALVGDRVRALIGVRVATSGTLYAFRARCSNEDCRAWIDWEVDMLDLPMKRLSAESRATYLAGNRFETIVGEKLVTFHLTTGEDQVRAFRKREQVAASAKRQQRESGSSESSGQGQILLGLAMRIVEVEGEPDIVTFLGELDLGEVHRLSRAMDLADCGIETTIDIVCDKCSEVTSTELPLDATFFRPVTTTT